MCLPGFAALYRFFWYFIPCCICRSARTIRKYHYFPDGYGSGIWACVAARESVSQGHHIQHASFTYDRIFLTAAISAATIKSYFKRNSRQYRKVLHYFKIYWHLIATNLLYTLGLYIHNFIFWTTDLKMTVAHTFVYAPAYDMATCLAMFTNLSSTIILSAAWKCIFMRGTRHIRRLLSVADGKISIMQKQNVPPACI